MAGTVEELLVFLKANTADFDKKMAASSRQVESFGTKGSSSLQKFASFGGAALAVTAGAAALVGTISVKAAIDNEKANARLENALKRTGQSYKDEKDRIESATGAMIRKGFADDDATDSLAKLVLATHDVSKAIKEQQVAADLAAGRNISLASATDLLVKVESGHYTQLARLGIATKEQIAGFKNSADAVAFLSDKYKGAAARAADTFAGRLRVLQATLEKTAADIGDKLLPIIEDLATGLGSTIQYFDENRGAAIALGVAVGAVLVPAMLTFIALKVGSFLGVLAGNLIQVAQFMYGAATATYAYATASEEAAAAATGLAATSKAAAAGVAAGPFLAVGAAVGVLTFGFYELDKALQGTGEALPLVTQDAKTLGSQGIAVLTKQLEQQNSQFKDHTERLNLLGLGFTKQGTAMKEFNKILKESPELAQRFIDAMGRSGLNTDAAEKALRRHIEAVNIDKHAQVQYQAAIDGVSAKQEELNRATSAAAKASDDAANATNRYRDALFAQFDANFAVIDAQKTLAEDLASTHPDLEQQEKDIIAVAKAAGEKAAQDLGPNATASAKAEAATRGSIKALQDLEVTYPQLKPVIDTYIASLSTIPPTKVTIPIFDKSGAEHDVQVLQSDIDRLHGTTVTIQMAVAGAEGVAKAIRNQYHAAHGEPLERAVGGPVYSGMPYIVGERGWELFVPDTSGTILTHSQSKALASTRAGLGGGSAAPVYNITVNSTVANADTGRHVVNAIKEYERSSGTSWRSPR